MISFGPSCQLLALLALASPAALAQGTGAEDMIGIVGSLGNIEIDVVKVEYE